MRGSFSGVRFADDYRTVAEGRILDMLLLAGSAYELGRPEAIAATREALDRWIDMGLGVRRSRTGERLFDPVEVVNVLKGLGLEGRDCFWADRYVRTGRRLVTDLSCNGGRGYIIHFRRNFSLRTVPVGKNLRLRMPLPLASIYGDELNIAPFIEGASDARLAMSDGRLEARFQAPGAPVTLGAKLRFPEIVRPSRTIHLLDLLPYLRAREGLIVITDRVSALAQALAGPDADAVSAVRAFWNYLLDELCCGAIHYDQVRTDAPCDSVLETGWYDCQLGSALFVALCRARQIPARLVSGHVLYQRAPTNHYWAEVWFNETGWTPFDLLSWDLSIGGRDSQWREHFYGRIDDRIISQRLPFEFTGALGVSLPDAWHIVQTASDDGVDISLVAVSGEPVYSDVISIGDWRN
ncbi:MAG TPA: transglutaminase-like domain-containing protein [Bryobacteraceae bacterium]|nr:transglutaminase-like domain-containing protein [Bryobacteraceae bacterium]